MMNVEQTIFRAKNVIPKAKPKTLSKSNVLSSFSQSIHSCHKHGDFVLYPSDKIKGMMGCPDCRKENDSYALSDFIKDAKVIHEDRYSYDDNEKYLENVDEKVVIKCSKHSYFMMTAKNHLKGKGCKQCESEEKFILNAKLIHGDDYNYKWVVYSNREKPVKIGCPKHGIFECKPLNHLRNGEGCPSCKYENAEFVNTLADIHENKYVYNNVKKSGVNNKITVGCKEHGDFEITIKSHLNGNGCPRCGSTGLMPRESKNLLKVDKILVNNKVKKEKRFSDCRNIYPLPFDRYVEELNLCIEYDGRQHFEDVGFLSNDYLSQQQKHDAIKTEYCINNGINLLRIKYTQDAEVEIKNMLKLLKDHSDSIVVLMYGEISIYDKPKPEEGLFYNVRFSM